jgi:hypothetical protein
MRKVITYFTALPQIPLAKEAYTVKVFVPMKTFNQNSPFLGQYCDSDVHEFEIGKPTPVFG